MGLSLFELCIINIISYFLEVTPSLYLLDEMLPGKMKLKTIMSISLVMSVIHGVIASLLTDLQLPMVPMVNAILITVLRISVDILILYILFQKQSFRLYGMFAMIGVMFTIIDDVTTIFRWTLLRDVGNTLAHQLLWIPFTLMAISFTLFMVRKQSLLLKKIAHLFESTQVMTLSIITFVGADLGSVLLLFYLDNYLEIEVFANRLIMISYDITFYLLIASLMLMFANSHYHKQEVLTSQLTILQQETYVKRLETIQKEMRLLQHDYKNILASTFLNVSNAPLEGAQQQVGDSLRLANLGIANDLKQVAQLSAIEILEIRSLIWSKQVEIEERHIRFQLEVERPIAKCDIRTTDLVRCLGILLDNAIEAVESLPQPSIELKLIQDEGQLTIIVQNALHQPISTDDIWQTGFSTKGQNRGLGLVSYQKIVDKYHNVAKETTVENNRFTQIMRIAS